LQNFEELRPEKMGGAHIIAFVLATTLALQSRILSGKILNYKVDLLRDW